MDLKDIQNLIKFVAKSGANEVKLEMEDIKITIRTGTGKAETTILQQSPMGIPQVPVPAPVTAAPPAEMANTDQKAREEAPKFVEITSPIIGTFYRKPSPDKPVFVEVGDIIQSDTVVCMVEAMKLFNEIEAEVSGKIVKVLIEDGTPVEFGQPLFLIDPS